MSDKDFIPLTEEVAEIVETKVPEVSTRSKKTEDGLDHKTLFVRSIPFEATSEDLADFFSKFAPVRHAVIVTDSEKKSRGFGFVSFSLDDDTLSALEKSRKEKFKDRLLRIDIAKRRDRNKKDGEAPVPVVKTVNVEKLRPRLIVRNLPWSVRRPEQLKKAFQKWGAVTEVTIPRKNNGRMSGFAFISFKKYTSAEKCVKESSGLKIDGREVAVDFAVAKSKWEEHVQANGKDEDSSTEEQDDDLEVDDEVEVDEEDVEADNDDLDDDEEAEDDKEFDELNDISKLDDDMEDDDEEEEEDHEPKNKQEAYSIFVRNIPYDATEESLKEHFEQFGPVKYALPVLDRETGLAKGTAFVAFYKEDTYTEVLTHAPEQQAASILIADDVSPLYVFEGRILSIAPTVDRQSASKLQERNSAKRATLLGKAPGEKDRRNLFLLNEGRITANSKLASLISQSDMAIREKSYTLRTQQLNKNPTLHISLTRLALRNLPRAMTMKSLKALGREAVVSFAKEVKAGLRQPLSKEELKRSTQHREYIGEIVDGVETNKTKKKGVVRQSKIIMEVKGSGEEGRSRGYGFLEFKDHRSALMALRWLNAHEITKEEIFGPLTEEEQQLVQFDDSKKKRLIVEFAIENAQVVKRRIDKVAEARKRKDKPEASDDKKKNNKRRRDDAEDEQQKDNGKSANKKQKKSGKKGNMNKGPKVAKTVAQTTSDAQDSNKVSEDVKRIIGQKRKNKQRKRN